MPKKQKALLIHKERIGVGASRSRKIEGRPCKGSKTKGARIHTGALCRGVEPAAANPWDQPFSEPCGLIFFRLRLFGGVQHQVLADLASIGADGMLDLVGDVGVLSQEGLGCFPALADA